MMMYVAKARSASLKLSLIAALLGAGADGLTAPLECQEWQTAHPAWLWCDDFERDSALEAHYFEVNRAGGLMGVSGEASFGGDNALRSEWTPGESTFGDVKLSFGRTPVSPQLTPSVDYDEIYWRFYTMADSRWSGPANKTSRITMFTQSNWSQGMIGHLWMGVDDSLALSIDPASGIGQNPSDNTVLTQGYNDFSNLRWLGLRTGRTEIFSTPFREQWVCVETRVKLNTPGSADGVFEFWVDGELEASREDLNWRSSFEGYGLNAIFLENYRGGGPSQNQARYFDNFVVSTERIGCFNSATRPHPPVILP